MSGNRTNQKNVFDEGKPKIPILPTPKTLITLNAAFELLIYCPSPSKRLSFMLDFLFSSFTQCQHTVTNNLTDYELHNGPKINYSASAVAPHEVWIIPQNLLAQTNITPIQPAIAWNNNTPTLFPTNTPNAYPFDIFSAIFFMLSRYEEYGRTERDIYGRFPANASLAMQQNFLHLPVVDIWAADFLAAIEQANPGLSFPKRKMQVQFSYDIDVAYAYKGRNVKRMLGSLAKNVLAFDLKTITEKLAVFTNQKQDPSDTYDYVIHSTIAPIFFFLVPEKISAYDKNISPNSKQLIALLQRLSARFPFGLHPSYYSSVEKSLLALEKQTLETIADESVTKSRQHYLKFTLPNTYRLLIENGITEDYSMAFAEVPSFRAGTCTPFYFFDIEKNEQTNLKVFPPCIMETMFRDDLHLPASEALPYFINCFNEVKKVNGYFCSIWHNDSLQLRADEQHPQNFRKLHTDFIHYIRAEHGAY